MKKLFYLCMATAAVALSACSDDNSSFNFEDIKGTAIVKGVVTYEPGYMADGSASFHNASVKQSVPANGAVVTVEVDNGEYVSSAEGTKVYQAITNEKGEYSIEVPAGIKAIHATVSVKDFEGTYSEYVNDGLLTVSGVKYATTSTEAVNLCDGRTETKNLALKIKNKPEVTTRSLKASVQGTVLSKAEEFLTDSRGNRTGLTSTTSALASAQVVLTFSNSDGRELHYETMTSSDGIFSLTASLFDDWNLSGTHVSLSILGKTGYIKHNYRKYGGYNWDSQQVKVYYAPYSASSSLSAKNSEVALDFGETVLDFNVLTDKDDIKGIGGSADKDKDGYQLYYYNDPLNLSGK